MGFVPGFSNTSYFVFFCAAALICIATIVLSKRRPTTQTRSLALVSATIFCIAAVLFTIFAEAFANQGLIFIALVSGGFGAAMMQVLWCDIYSYLDTSEVDLYMIVSFILSGGLLIGLGFIVDVSTALLFYAIMPAASLALLFRHFDAGSWEVSDELTKNDPAEPSRYPSVFWRFCLSVFIFVVIYNLAYTELFQAQAYLLHELPISVRNFTNILTALVLLIVFLIKKRLNHMMLYRASIIMMIAALLLYLALPEQYLLLVSILGAFGYKLFDVIFWCILVSLVHQNPQKRWQLLCFVFAANFLAMGIGMGLVGPGSALSSSLMTMFGDSIFVYIAVFALIIVIILVLPDSLLQHIGMNSSKQPKRTGDAEEMGIAEKSKLLASRYQLTKREREVLEFLAQGRTQSVIAQKLVIGEGTVHSHIMHIYQKLGIHSQQELIELVSQVK